jgi:hypothetical protein
MRSIAENAAKPHDQGIPYARYIDNRGLCCVCKNACSALGSVLPKQCPPGLKTAPSGDCGEFAKYVELLMGVRRPWFYILERVETTRFKRLDPGSRAQKNARRGAPGSNSPGSRDTHCKAQNSRAADTYARHMPVRFEQVFLCPNFLRALQSAAPPSNTDGLVSASRVDLKLRTSVTPAF